MPPVVSPSPRERPEARMSTDITLSATNLIAPGVAITGKETTQFAHALK